MWLRELDSNLVGKQRIFSSRLCNILQVFSQGICVVSPLRKLSVFMLAIFTLPLQHLSHLLEKIPLYTARLLCLILLFYLIYCNQSCSSCLAYESKSKFCFVYFPCLGHARIAILLWKIKCITILIIWHLIFWDQYPVFLTRDTKHS